MNRCRAAYVRGEYGTDDRFIALPTILRKTGVKRIIELALTADERQHLLASAMIRSMFTTMDVLG